jgi:hypothetical protein
MNPIIFSEEKDLPIVPFIVMVIAKNGRQLPYCVARVGRGGITGATMLKGEYLYNIVKNPEKIYDLNPDANWNTRMYIQNEINKGHHKDVKCYRRILPGDLAKLRRKILRLTIKDSFPHKPSMNEDIKKRFIELSTLL